MSSVKDYWFDRIEIHRKLRLAHLLGITEDELEQIDYEIDGEYSNDGLLYGYIVRFADGNDPCVMGRINGLVSGSYVRLSQWDLEDPDEEELEWGLVNSEQLEMFNKHLAEVPAMLQMKTTPSAQFSLLVMLHAHVVSALEHFLSTTFIYRVTNSERLTRRLIETDPEFGSRKFTVSEIYTQHSNIKSTVAAYLKDFIFHEMRKVKPMFAEVLSYDFGDISWLFRAVLIRHDCVHRAGYGKDGVPVTLSADSIRELVSNCRALAEDIDSYVQCMSAE